jgi:S1-C subfamily serine protease
VRLDGAAAPTVLSEADGRFMLTGLAPGTVTLRAETADRFGLAQGLTIVSGATVDAGAIRLDAVRTDTEAQTLTRVTTGIIWRPDGTGWAVDRVLPEANAAAASLLPGDRLVAVDAAEAAAWSLAQLQSALAGEPGTSITLRLERNARPFTIRVQRQALPGQ